MAIYQEKSYPDNPSYVFGSGDRTMIQVSWSQILDVPLGNIHLQNQAASYTEITVTGKDAQPHLQPMVVALVKEHISQTDRIKKSRLKKLSVKKVFLPPTFFF